MSLRSFLNIVLLFLAVLYSPSVAGDKLGPAVASIAPQRRAFQAVVKSALMSNHETELSRIWTFCEIEGQAAVDIIATEALEYESDEFILQKISRLVQSLPLGDASNVTKGVLPLVKSGDPYRVRVGQIILCLLYTSPSPRDQRGSRMPSSA